VAFDPQEHNGDDASENCRVSSASREWAKRARSGGVRVAVFLEAIAGASLNVATFLKTPPALGPDDLEVR
jgi:hypothetical protein